MEQQQRDAGRLRVQRLADELGRAKGAAQQVRERWPADADGERQIEQAVELLGHAVDGLDELVQRLAEGDPQVTA